MDTTPITFKGHEIVWDNFSEPREYFISADVAAAIPGVCSMWKTKDGVHFNRVDDLPTIEVQKARSVGISEYSPPKTSEDAPGSTISS